MQTSITPAGDNQMPKAIEVIIKDFEGMSNIRRNDISVILGDLIQRNTGRPVEFHPMSSEYRRFPQLFTKWYEKDVVHVRLFTSHTDDFDPSCENILRQLSIAAVLVGSPADLVDDLDPDMIPADFSQKYKFLSKLADSLFDVMSKALIPSTNSTDEYTGIYMPSETV